MKLHSAMTRAVAATVMVAASVLALSACTGSSSDGGDAGSRTITVINSNDAPFTFTDADGKLTGIDGDMINWIAEKNGWKVQTFTTEFSTMIAALKAGKGDVIADGMYVTDERKKEVSFTDTWYIQGEGMLVPADSTLASRDEVKGKVVGAQTGTVFQDWITTLEPSDTKFFDSQAALLQAVANKQVDAAFTDYAVVSYSLVQNPNDKVKLAAGYEPYFPGTIAASVRPDDTELLDELNAGLKELQASPDYQKILEKYGLTASNAANK